MGYRAGIRRSPGHSYRTASESGLPMTFDVVVHYDNQPRFRAPHLWVWYSGSTAQDDLAQTGVDDFGPVFAVSVRRADFGFTFKDGPGPGGPWEGSGLDRTASVPAAGAGPAEMWCRGDRA